MHVSYSRTNICSSIFRLSTDLRRDTYEDFTFPLETVLGDGQNPLGFDLHSLRNYAKRYSTKDCS